jgi:hypothetical protein
MLLLGTCFLAVYLIGIAETYISSQELGRHLGIDYNTV